MHSIHMYSIANKENLSINNRNFFFQSIIGLEDLINMHFIDYAHGDDIIATLVNMKGIKSM